MAVRTFEVRGPIPRARAWATGLAVATALGTGAALASLVRGAWLDVAFVIGASSLFVAAKVGQMGLAWANRVREKTGELVLGKDGLLWRTNDAHTFVPWDEVGVVQVHWDAALLPRAGAEPIRMRTGGAQKIARVVAEERAAYATRARAEVPSLLEHDPNAEAWLERQRRRGAGDYRDAAIEPSVLVRVAEDPSASLLVRVGAVLGLPESAEAERARIRVALDDVADPEGREAIEAALENRVSPSDVRKLANRR